MSSSIVKFYAGKTVLVTGGTGFMGRVLVEKLLRSCPDIGRIYLLVRPKKGLTTNQRMQEYFNNDLFQHANKSSYLANKVQAIQGDITKEKFGLNSEDLMKVSDNVNVFLHMAANVDLGMKLQDAVTNILVGAKNALDLSNSMKNLQSLVHVSTAYIGVKRPILEERVYEPPISPSKLLALHSAGKCNEQQDELISNWSLSYLYAKAVTEAMISEAQMRMKAPVAIFRPATVSPTSREPFPGWIDNFYGMSGLVYAVCTGLGPLLRLNPNVNAQYVPCDMAINSLLASAWDTANNKSNQMKVFNYTADQNPILLKYVLPKVVQYSNFTSYSILPHPAWVVTNASIDRYKKYMFLAHTIPARVLDFIDKLRGQDRRLSRKVKTVNSFLANISDANTYHLKCTTNNIDDLWQKLSPEDQSIFPFNMKDVNWDDFINNSVQGIQKHMVVDRERAKQMTAKN